MDIETMTRACASTEKIVGGVQPDQYDLATPCTEWSVRQLLNHLTGTLLLGQALLSDTPPPEGASPPGGQPAIDVVGDHPLAAYRTGVAGLLAASGGDAFDRPHQTPLGEMPGAVLGGFTALDILVHGWDLARATGQEPAMDEVAAAAMLAFAREAVTDDTRAPLIGPELPARDDASVTDRLVAYMGRTP
jgi:uncharacterized protein (TIGR03086 family)